MRKQNGAGQKQAAKGSRCRASDTLQSETLETRERRCGKNAGKKMGKGRNNS